MTTAPTESRAPCSVGDSVTVTRQGDHFTPAYTGRAVNADNTVTDRNNISLRCELRFTTLN